MYVCQVHNKTTLSTRKTSTTEVLHFGWVYIVGWSMHYLSSLLNLSHVCTTKKKKSHSSLLYLNEKILRRLQSHAFYRRKGKLLSSFWQWGSLDIFITQEHRADAPPTENSADRSAGFQVALELCFWWDQASSIRSANDDHLTPGLFINFREILCYSPFHRWGNSHRNGLCFRQLLKQQAWMLCWWISDEP